MSGTVIWTYFADCLTKTSETFVSNANLFGKVYFPRLAVPVSILISNLITFAIQFALFLVFVVYFALQRHAHPAQLGWIAAHPAAGADDGRAGAGLRHHHLLADHQVPRPALPGAVRRVSC